MTDSPGLAALVTRGLLLIATLAVAALNGAGLSPMFDTADYMLGNALRGYPYMTRANVNAYVAPVALVLMTLAIAGVPAALYERIRGLQSSTAVSLAIWLVVAALLTVPEIIRVYFIVDDFR